MATKILILILGISNLHAEKHNKGEHYVMTQYTGELRILNNRQLSPFMKSG